MKTFTLFLMVGILILTGCKKEDSATNSDTFTDKLTMGTGVSQANSMVLTGEGSAFNVYSFIYYRLESKDDFENQPIHIAITRLVNNAYVTVDTLKHAAMGNSGKGAHVLVSSFRASSTAGSYRVTGIIASRGKIVATKDFTLN